MTFLKSKNMLIGAMLFVITIGLIAFFDTALATGILLVSFLTAATFLVLSKMRIKSRGLFLLFLIALLIHFGAVLVIHYFDFQPFSGGTGDYTRYQASAQEIAQRVRGGNFSLEGLWVPHSYPLLLGYIYALTLPSMLIGQLFNAWVAALAVLLLYCIVREVGGSHKRAFVIGCIASLYPSHIFFSSLLLKDVVVVTLSLAGLLVLLRLLKGFSWKVFFLMFVLFYVILIGLLNLRFYIGFVLLGTFIFSWFFFSALSIKKRITYAFIIVPVLGFAPQIFGYGYYGIETVRDYLAPERIAFYKETAYKPTQEIKEILPLSEVLSPRETSPVETLPPRETSPVETFSKEAIGSTSSFDISAGFENPKSFVLNNGKSFIYSVFGPFPWQFTYSRHLLSLSETLPWYVLFFFILRGMVYSIRKRREALSLLVFSLGVFGAIALFFSNYGIMTRIRMPAFFALLPFMAIYVDSKRSGGISKPFFMQRKFFGTWLYLIILYLRIRARLWHMFFMFRHKKERWFEKTINGNIMFLDGKDKGISRELLYAGIREARSTRFLQTFLRPGDICVDIGANIGYYALQEARLVGGEGKVFAIEPSHHNIELLKRNVGANRFENIAVYRAAVGSRNTTGEIHLSLSSNQHSFLKMNQYLSGETEEVEIITLDTFLRDKPSPQFVRMDVEGYEQEVIRGMRGVLSSGKPLKMFIEHHTPYFNDGGRELLTTLRDAGFRIRAVFKERYSMLERENRLIVSLYDFVFSKRFYLFNNSSENYDVPIDDFLERLPRLKENVFEVFFERK